MKYLSRVAFMVLSLFVSSGAWAADPVTITDPYDSEWCFVIASQGPGTIKSSIDNNTFTFKNYVDRNGTRITGEINQNDVNALAGLTYPANYPTFLDLKGVSYSGDVTLTLNSIFTGLRLPYGSDLTAIPSTVGYAFYSNYTKINYNDGSNESIPIYLYVKEGYMNAAISKLGDYLNYRTVYLSGTFSDEEKSTLEAKPGITINPSGGSEGGGGGGSTVDPTTLTEKIAARAQITNVPTIYIDLPEIGDKSLGEYLYKKVGSDTTPEEAPYRPAKIQVVATSDTSSPHYLESFIEDAYENGKANLEIKVRGNSTALPSIPTGKRPYRLKFANKKNSVDGKAHKHDLLGYGYSKRNWVLLANLNDNSLLRNALTYHIGKAVGLPFCPGYKFVDLVINNEYRGSYQITDQCEVDANRININEDTGWYVEFQGRNDMCDYPMCFAEGGVLMNINNPEPADETNEEQRNAIINPVKDWFLNSWKKAFGVGYTNPETGWRAYNDEETLLKFWIATELTGDYDGLMSVKAYREADGKLCWGPLWDKDLAFGNWDSMAAPDGKLVANLKQASCVQGYFENLTKDPTFMAHAKETLDNLIGGGIKTTLLAKIDEMADVVRETQKLNHDKWGDHPSGAFGHVDGLADYQAYVDQLKEWLSDRIDYVQERFAELVVEANKVTGSLTLDAAKSQADNGITVDIQDKLYNVTLLNKTFEKGKWSAISLPFAVNEQTLKSVFGDQYELKELAGIYSNGTTLYFATPANNAIIPGMPYLIKPSKVVAANPVFNGVMLAYCPDWTNNHKAYGESVTFGNYTFSANLYLNSLNVDGTDLLIGGDAASFTFPQKANSWDTTGPVYGLNAYIRKANGAVNPVISFQEETPVETVELIHGEPYAITENTTVDKVVYKRTFEKARQNHYQVWFVPFNYTISGNENADFYGINLISATNSLDGMVTDNTKVYIFIEKRNPGSTLSANRPYIIKAHQQDYEFVSESEEGVMLYAPTSESRLKMETSAFAYNFYGTYDTFYATKGHDWLSLNKNGAICWNATTASKLGSYCWYIKATPKSENDDYSKISFIFSEESDEEATDITFFNDNSKTESYFSPNGIQLEKPMKGLNIIKMKDGTTRKILVK